MNMFLIAAVLGIAGVGAFFSEEITDTVEINMGDWWTKYDAQFKRYGSLYGIDWRWLKAFALTESDLGREKSVARGIESPTDVAGSTSSDKLSWGLMQVTIKTGKALDPLCTEVRLNDPEYSIKLAAQLIASDKKQFSSSDSRFTEWVVKSYNQGAPRTKKERDGKDPGYAHEYWARWQRNFTRVEDNPS